MSEGKKEKFRFAFISTSRITKKEIEAFMNDIDSLGGKSEQCQREMLRIRREQRFKEKMAKMGVA
jgi:hypothetical protein